MLKNLIKVSAVAAFAFAFVVAPVASAVETTAVYDAVPKPLASSNSSLGFEAQQTAEFGAKIRFAAGERKFDSATIVMNSWACQSGQWEQNNCTTTPGSTFSQELTLNIYPANDALTPIKTVKQTFNIPFRPSDENACGADSTQWMDAKGNCQNGMNVPVTFNLNGLVLPDEIVFGVEYNTFAWGYDKIGVTGPYDSLNVSVDDDIDTTSGTQLQIYRAYQGNGNVFQAEEDWGDYVVAAQFNAVKVMPQDACKNNGWKTMKTAEGKDFKNQGQCVSYQVANENAKIKR